MDTRYVGFTGLFFTALTTSGSLSASDQFADYFVPGSKFVDECLNVPRVSVSDGSVILKFLRNIERENVSCGSYGMQFIPADSFPYSVIYATHRRKRPKCINHMARITEKRRREFSLSDITRTWSSPTITPVEAVNRAEKDGLISEGSHGEFQWQIGILPPEAPEELRTLWTISKAEGNPLQMLRVLKREAKVRVAGDKRGYFIIPNRYPVLASHALLVSNEVDKPQYISSHEELAEIVRLLIAVHAAGGGDYIIGFNGASNVRGYGGASIRCWHAHFIRLPRKVALEPLARSENLLSKVVSELAPKVAYEFLAIAGNPVPHIVIPVPSKEAASHTAEIAMYLLDAIVGVGYSYNVVILGYEGEVSIAIFPRASGFTGGFLEAVGNIVIQDEATREIVQGVKNRPGALATFYKRITSKIAPSENEMREFLTSWLSIITSEE